MMIPIRILALVAASASLISPATAASKAPKPASVCAPTPTPTSPGTLERRVGGIITTVYGQNDIAVRGDDGSVVEVQITNNTILAPLGMHLEVGRRVKVWGHVLGCTLVARKIMISYS